MSTLSCKIKTNSPKNVYLDMNLTIFYIKSPILIYAFFLFCDGIEIKTKASIDNLPINAFDAIWMSSV